MKRTALDREPAEDDVRRAICPRSGFLAGALLLSFLSATASAAPAVTLVSPADQSLVRSTTVPFTCSASDGAGLLDATLYVGKEPQTVGLSGFAVTDDARLASDKPSTKLGNDTSIKVSGLPKTHAVIKFPTLIGSGSNQVPPGTEVHSAILEVNCTNRGDLLKLYRLTEDWNEGEVTWNERKRGVPWSAPGADGAGSNAGVALDGDCTEVGLRPIDITPFVQEWCDGAANHGIVITSSGDDGIFFGASEGNASPILTVVHQFPFSRVLTRTLSGQNGTATFTATLPDLETHAWNCLVRNTSGQESWAPADFRVVVDTRTPDPPALVSPANDANGQSLSPTLAVNVSDPNNNLLTVNFFGREAVLESDFTIVALPDTQYYAESYPYIFTSQTQWIVNNAALRNIAFVTHEGDIVNVWDSTIQWQRANASMSLLDGVVPYGTGPGNHDQPTNYYNLYFPYTRYQAQPWYGGHYGSTNDNNFELFSVSGVDFLVIHIEFCPPAPVLAWADSILEAFPQRRAIITTHGFLDASGERSVNLCEDTQYIWDALVAPNPNVWFVLCGHVHYEFRRTDIANGHPVHQLLADYQTLAKGGNGWLRTLRFSPSANKVFVETYSPWLNSYQTDANSQFELDFPMSEFSQLGTVAGVPSGSSASLVWPGLAANTAYEWYAAATDSTGRVKEGPLWRFSTGNGNAGSLSIAFDGFESGSFAGGRGWLFPWTKSGDISLRTSGGPHTGTYHVRLRSSTGYLERAANLAGLTGVHLKFWAKVKDFENADRALVKVSPNGGTYTTVKTFSTADSDGLYHAHEIDLSAFPMTAQFRIAFDAEMNTTGDTFLVDDVEITAGS